MNVRKTYGTVLWLVITVGLTGPSWSQEIEIVSPSSAAGVEGNGTSKFGQPAPVHIQNLFPATDFATLPDSHRTITGIAWRQDESSALTVPVTVPVAITLATTTADTLAPTFADNLGADKQIVFDDEIVWQSDDTGPGPRNFDVVVHFEDAFTYDPSGGKNLVLDLVAMTNGSHQFQIDRQRTEGITWQASHGGSVAEFPGESIWVTQFTFVPEPSTMLSCIGFLSLLAWRRKNPSA